jgi:hypothetical protein
MKTGKTHTRNDTTKGGKLYLAFEMSNAEWKLGLTIGLAQAPRWRTLKARNLKGLRQEILCTSQNPAIEQVRRLLRLKGIGINSAWIDVMEFFAWRNFRNRRELGCLV